MPAAFLTFKGRISATTVMYDASLDDTGPPTVVLEVESSTGQDFLQYLKLYKLRSKVTIKSIGWRICFTPKESGATSDHPPNVVAKVEDPRLPNFGVRSLVPDVAG
jgi:folate-binding Fe-S cluster repair protein YgfZ